MTLFFSADRNPSTAGLARRLVGAAESLGLSEEEGDGQNLLQARDFTFRLFLAI